MAASERIFKLLDTEATVLAPESPRVPPAEIAAIMVMAANRFKTDRCRLRAR